MPAIPCYVSHHTPAPWSEKPVEILEVDFAFLAGPNGVHLGEWHEGRGMGRAAEPNRRALLAAPAMLELLIQLESDLTAAGATGQPLKRIREVIEQAGAEKVIPRKEA